MGTHRALHHPSSSSSSGTREMFRSEHGRISARADSSLSLAHSAKNTYNSAKTKNFPTLATVQNLQSEKKDDREK
jgi:hypothetical protein